MEVRSSFSQHSSFEKCKRMWFFQKVKQIPVIQDMCYAHAGNVIHKCLELFYNKEVLTLKDLKIRFENLWDGKNLHKTKLVYKKDEYWDMCINGVNLNKQFTSTELKIYYPDVVAYLDCVNTDIGEICDWKSSTRREENEIEYTQQLKLYCWLYYRKFDKLPIKASVYYLKYIGEKGELSFIPTMDDITEVEKWYNDILKEMAEIKETEKTPPICDECFMFCPYQNICQGYENANLLKFKLRIVGNNIFLDGPISNLLNKGLHKKFSYELKDAYYIKKAKPYANTTVDFWNERNRTLPLAMKDALVKTLTDYSKWKKLEIVIDIDDQREFDKTKVEMPEKFINGKELRDYQSDAVDIFLRNKIGILQMGTGSGKTETSIECIRRLEIKTLFIVDKIELLKQTKKRIEDSLGIEVGQIGQGVEDIKDVTVATIQSLVLRLNTIKKINSFKIQIIRKNWKIYSNEYNIVYPEDEEFNKNENNAQIKADEYKIEEEKYQNVYNFSDKEKKDIEKYKKIVEKEKQDFCEYLASVRFCIFDECHKTAANSFLKISRRLINSEYRQGLCLHKQTNILDNKGYIKNITNIKIGDKVLSYNHKLNKIEEDVVKNTFKKEKEICYVIKVKTNKGERVIKCSNKHKFYCNGKYINAEQLKEGDSLSLFLNPHGKLDNPSKRLEVREKISKKLKGRKLNYIPVKAWKKGHNTWNKGKTKEDFPQIASHRKGITVEEEHGQIKGTQLRKKNSDNIKKNWNENHEELTYKKNLYFSKTSNKPWFEYNKRIKIKQQTNENGDIICEECNKKIEGYKRLHCHHKDKNRKNNKLENLEIVCAKCHKKVEK